MSNIGGPNAQICTSKELEETKLGRRALQRWAAGDDTGYLLDTIILEGDVECDPAGTGLHPAL
ncbi:MAG: hypothetical protein ACRDKS_01175 [Actinomycetota bacterium]